MIEIVETIKIEIDKQLESINKEELLEIALYFKAQNDNLKRKLKKQEVEIEKILQEAVTTFDIYKMYFVEEPEKVYIGKAKDYKRRLKSHLQDLKSGRHMNKEIIELYERYGANSLKSELVERLEAGYEEILEIEKRYIDTFKENHIVLNRMHNETYQGGRPKKFNEEDIQSALKLLENHSYNEVTELTGISKSTLIRAKKEKIG